MTDTRGYIYFVIKTEDTQFELAEFENFLSIKPTSVQKMFERGNVPKSTSWRLGTAELINPHFFQEVEKLIATLKPHKDEFKKLKTVYPDFKFVLQVVLYLGDESPGLNFSNETIELINDVGAEIDCDIYNKK